MDSNFSTHLNLNKKAALSIPKEKRKQKARTEWKSWLGGPKKTHNQLFPSKGWNPCKGWQAKTSIHFNKTVCKEGWDQEKKKCLLTRILSKEGE